MKFQMILISIQSTQFEANIILKTRFIQNRFDHEIHPTIAQLAERETVEAKQLSLGHWFESGWSEIFFLSKFSAIMHGRCGRDFD